MKKTIQTKRNKPSGSTYRVLYAKTGRKRRLNAATTAAVEPHVELESDVPNVGIGRALLVILILHVVAIAAIYIHSTFFGGEGETASGGSSAPPAAAVAAAAEDKPAEAAPAPAAPADNGGNRYIVVTGDTYHRIAQVRNVDQTALRALNGNRPLRAGVVLDLPAELSSRPVQVPAPAPAVRETPEPRPVKPSVAVIDGDKTPGNGGGFRAVETNPEPDVSNAPKAVVVKPRVQRPAQPAGVEDSGTTYTIRSGDTLWSISRRFKVSRDGLLKLNGIKDANKLYAGRTIKIPAR